MLDKLGIFGLEKIEDAVLAGLVTGDPILLVGSHGTGKTLLCERLASALGFSFWAYDAGKALFEDVLGFPDPKSLAEGKVEYAATPVSIWGKEFVLVDELSRANPSMQNKWLELIRSRRIMGKSLDDLKHIVAAMNPPTYLGAHPLDAALAGRFAMVVQVPETREMNEAEVGRIVVQVSASDAPLLAAPARRHEGAELKPFIAACRDRVLALDDEKKQKLLDYVLAVHNFMASREVPLDGRRLGMIWRALQACLAVTMEKQAASFADAELADFTPAIAAGLANAVPFTALAEKNAFAAVAGAHQHAAAALNGGVSRRVFVMPTDPGKIAETFRGLAPTLSNSDLKSALTQALSRARSNLDPEQKAGALLALSELAHDLCEGDLELDPDDQQRLLAAYRAATIVDNERQDGMVELLSDSGLETDADFAQPEAFLAFRLAFFSVYKRRDHFGRGSSSDEVLRLAREIHRLMKGG